MEENVPEPSISWARLVPMKRMYIWGNADAFADNLENVRRFISGQKFGRRLHLFCGTDWLLLQNWNDPYRDITGQVVPGCRLSTARAHERGTSLSGPLNLTNTLPMMRRLRNGHAPSRTFRPSPGSHPSSQLLL